MKTFEAEIVQESWNKFVVPMPDYHKLFGVWLFQKYVKFIKKTLLYLYSNIFMSMFSLFGTNPEMIKLFHFAKDHDMSSKELWESHRMITHAKLVATTIEEAVVR